MIDVPLWQVGRGILNSPLQALQWVFYGDPPGEGFRYVGVFLMLVAVLVSMMVE